MWNLAFLTSREVPMVCVYNGQELCLGMKGGYGRALQTAPGGGQGSGGRTVSRGQQALGRPEGEALGGLVEGLASQKPPGFRWAGEARSHRPGPGWAELPGARKAF